MDVLFNLKLDN